MWKLGILIGGFLIPAVAFATPATIDVNGSVEHQTIEGFGATHLSHVFNGTDTMSSELRNKLVDLVYGQVGITLGNLSIHWDRNPPEPVNDNTDPFTTNFAAMDWRGSIAMKTKVYDLARAKGADNLYLANQVNSRWLSPWLSSIKSSDYNRYLDEASELIAAQAVYWRDQYGIVPRYQMPMNEPTSGNDELLDATGQELADIVKRAGARLTTLGFTNVKFVVPAEETEDRSLTIARVLVADPGARQYIGAIAYHTYPYGSTYSDVKNILSTSGSGAPQNDRISLRNAIRDLGAQYKIPVWMTEVSNGHVDPFSFDDLRGRAIHIHDEFLYADAAAYFGMANFWNDAAYQLHTGRTDLSNEEGTIAFGYTGSGQAKITGMGYAIGHYARWIRRGDVRIDATSSDRLLQVTAFRNATRNTVTMVVINNSAADAATTIQLANIGQSVRPSISGEQSTAAAYWQPLATFQPANPDRFTLTFPRESVTTVIFAQNTSAPTPTPTSTPAKPSAPMNLRYAPK